MKRRRRSRRSDEKSPRGCDGDVWRWQSNIARVHRPASTHPQATVHLTGYTPSTQGSLLSLKAYSFGKTPQGEADTRTHEVSGDFTFPKSWARRSQSHYPYRIHGVSHLRHAETSITAVILSSGGTVIVLGFCRLLALWAFVVPRRHLPKKMDSTDNARLFPVSKRPQKITSAGKMPPGTTSEAC